MSDREGTAAAPMRLTFAEVVEALHTQLTAFAHAPHEEHPGPLCPICGLVGNLRQSLRQELDDLALREHVGAHPTPPSGQTVERVETVGELSPPKTTMFRKPDGSPLIEITLAHTFSKMTGLRRRRDG